MQTLRRQRKQQFEKILLEEKIYSTSQEDRERLLSKLLDAAESRTERKTDDLQGEYITSIETAIQADVPVTQEIVDRANLRDIAPKMFEKALGFTKALPWWSNKDWNAFGEWVVERYAESKTSFGEYNIWRSGDGRFSGAMSNPKIRQFPNLFYDSWDMFSTSAQPEQSPVERRIKNLERDL